MLTISDNLSYPCYAIFGVLDVLSEGTDGSGLVQPFYADVNCRLGYEYVVNTTGSRVPFGRLRPPLGRTSKKEPGAPHTTLRPAQLGAEFLHVISVDISLGISRVFAKGLSVA